MATSTHFNLALSEFTEVFVRRSMSDFFAFMKSTGLSMTQFSTMFRLFHKGSCGVSDVGESLGVTNAAASQMVEKLVQLGHLQRAENPEDRRNKLLTLTPEGEELIQESFEVRRRWMDGLTKFLTDEEQEQILRSLILLTQAIRRFETESQSQEISASERSLMPPFKN